MILSVVRYQQHPNAALDEISGWLELDGAYVCRCVERASLALPHGRFPVSVRGDAPGETISPALGRKVVWIEANRGWTYVHVTSRALNLKGCVGVPKRSIEDWLLAQVEAELARGGTVQAVIHQLPG